MSSCFRQNSVNCNESDLGWGGAGAGRGVGYRLRDLSTPPAASCLLPPACLLPPRKSVIDPQIERARVIGSNFEAPMGRYSVYAAAKHLEIFGSETQEQCGHDS